MCGRFTLRTPTEAMADFFRQLTFPEIPPSYNIAPTQPVAAIRHRDDQPQFAWLRWGLIPSWAKDKKIGSRMINARAETVHEKPAFRAAFKRRRCIVIADGFYEWKAVADGKQPYYITMKDDRPFGMAGLWEINSKLDERLETCTVITTTPNSLMAPIHDRMPAVLSASQFDMWLDPAFDDREALRGLLEPFDSEQMSVRPVSRNVNKVSFNEPVCIDPVPIQADLDF